MQADSEKFQQAGATILVVVKESDEKVRSYWREHGLSLHAIADPKGELTEQFGQQWKLHKLGRMPAQIVIDCQGRVVFAHYGSGMSDIVPDEKMLELIRSLPACHRG